MNIILNGENKEIQAGATVSALISTLESLPKFYVIEHNGNIVYKEKYAETALSEGDKVELVMFTGGG